MEPAQHRMDLVDARDLDGRAHRIDDAAMAAGRHDHEAAPLDVVDRRLLVLEVVRDAHGDALGRVHLRRLAAERGQDPDRHERREVVVEHKRARVIGVAQAAGTLVAGAQVAGRVVGRALLDGRRLDLALPGALGAVGRDQDPLAAVRALQSLDLAARLADARRLLAGRAGADAVVLVDAVVGPSTGPKDIRFVAFDALPRSTTGSRSMRRRSRTSRTASRIPSCERSYGRPTPRRASASSWPTTITTRSSVRIPSW